MSQGGRSDGGGGGGSGFGCAWRTGWERSPGREQAPPPATMGNVLAASSPPAGPPPPPAPALVGLPPPPPAPPGFTLPPLGGGLSAGTSAGRGSERTAGASAAGVADDGACGCLPNPGTFEECHRKCKELFPIQMEGVKLTVNKGLSNHFQVNHTVALSTVGESNYHFGVTYVGTKQLSPTEAFPVLVGDMDNSGSLNAQVIHQLGPGLRSKMAHPGEWREPGPAQPRPAGPTALTPFPPQTQQSKFVNWQVDGEYRGSDFTAAVTLGNPDVLVGSGERRGQRRGGHELRPRPVGWAGPQGSLGTGPACSAPLASLGSSPRPGSAAPSASWLHRTASQRLPSGSFPCAHKRAGWGPRAAGRLWVLPRGRPPGPEVQRP
uniref:Translocase of outer mitochondrial membrane 40 n=1 Tax=Oryctolagus cuniculus TaxID=9986 RepID=G1TTL7_RABIT